MVRLLIFFLSQNSWTLPLFFVKEVKKIKAAKRESTIHSVVKVCAINLKFKAYSVLVAIFLFKTSLSGTPSILLSNQDMMSR